MTLRSIFVAVTVALALVTVGAALQLASMVKPTQSLPLASNSNI